MKRLVVPIVLLSILMFACSISSTPTAPVATTAPMATTAPAATNPAAATETSTAVVVPQPTNTSAPQTNATCNELSLFLDPALASGFSCQTIPEAGDQNAPAFLVNPKYTEISFTGYILSDRFFSPKIDVYPVQRFSELSPDSIPTKVAELQALIAGGPTGVKGLPFLPNFDAGQEFFAQYKVIPFGSGNGARYLSQFSQFLDPINNNEVFYTFQGLTSDGKYWISAILPISNPLLPADGKNPPNGQSWDDFNNAFPTYLAALTTQLNAAPPQSYSPAIPMLDALISSISIH